MGWFNNSFWDSGSFGPSSVPLAWPLKGTVSTVRQGYTSASFRGRPTPLQRVLQVTWAKELPLPQPQLLPKPAFHPNAALPAPRPLWTQDLPSATFPPLYRKGRLGQLCDSHSHPVTREQSSRVRYCGFEGLLCHLPSCMTLGKLLNFSKTLFPCL